MLEDANLLDNDGEGGGSRTTGTSIVVNGAVYATSLFWQPIQNANDFMVEVEEASTDIVEGADLFAVKGGKTPQFGMCVSQDGYKKGTNSAAIALMTALSDFSSIVGVFKVGDGWWYVCSRNDVILSDGDMLYLDEEEAKNQLLSMLTVPDWDKKFAPPEWSLSETEKGDLGAILEKGKHVKLQKIKALRGSKLIIVVVTCVVAAWLVLSKLFDFLMAPPARKVVAPIRPKVVNTAPIVVPKPWEKIKSPKEFMTNCQKGIMDMATILPPGWESSGKILCTGEKVGTSWKKGVGLLAWADESMRTAKFENLQYYFDDSGTSLSAALSLPKLSTENNAPTKNMKDLRFELNKLFQEMGIKITFGLQTIKLEAQRGPEAQSPMRKGPPQKAASVVKEIQVITFKVSSGYNPTTWLQLLTKFSSFEIKNIEYTTKDSSWNYEGVFYVL